MRCYVSVLIFPDVSKEPNSFNFKHGTLMKVLRTADGLVLSEFFFQNLWKQKPRVQDVIPDTPAMSQTVIADFSPPSPTFVLRPIHVRFVVNEVAFKQVSLQLFLFSPLRIIPPIHHTYLHLHVAVNKTTNG